MNWEQAQISSFGYLDAPPLTPNKTPTIAASPSSSPTPKTPKNNNDPSEIHSGWTPIFAEEYSVFNTSPGPLLKTQTTILDAQEQQVSRTQREKTFPPNFPYQFQQSTDSNPTVSLPSVEPSRQLTSSPQLPLNLPSNLPKNVAQKVTPRKTRGSSRLEEISAQSSTPLHPTSRGVRHLAAKPAVDSLSQFQTVHHGSSQQNRVPPLNLSAISTQTYLCYPISAPATVHSHSHTKSFWGPDPHIAGMDFENSDYAAGGSNANKQSNSFDWARDNDVFQDSANNARFDQDSNVNVAEPDNNSKSMSFNNMQRHGPPYQTEHLADRKRHQFESPTKPCVVDPGILFSLPVTSNDFRQALVKTLSDHGTHEAVVRRPYQHQLRQSKLDQQEEESRRSQLSSQASFHFRGGRANFESPPRPNPIRANLHRGVSEKIGSKFPSQANERLSRSREHHSSPIKNQNLSSLKSIPEFTNFQTDDNKPTARTDITFTIDAYGQARTETTIAVPDPTPRKRSASLANIGLWNDSSSDSSSDEDLITIPSQNASSFIPSNKTRRIARYQRTGRRGRGGGSISSGGPESEPESTMLDIHPDERIGDAATALRKVMEGWRVDRRSNSHGHPRTRRAMAEITPVRTRITRGSRCTNTSNTGWEGIASTPSTAADSYDTGTPGTDGSGITRCVCGLEGDGELMIQCDSCTLWLHARCLGINQRRVPKVFVCAFCTKAPGGRGRGRTGLRNGKGWGGGDGGGDRAALPSSPLTGNFGT